MVQPRHDVTWPSRRLRAIGWLAAVGLLTAILYWPAMRLGFLADDLFQISVIEGLFDGDPWFGLYLFALEDPETTASHVARGSLPWWTIPDFRFAHLRPLSSLLIAFDHAMWPRDAFVHHLHSLAWLWVVLGAAYLLLCKASTRALAALALAVFAIDETVSWTVGWLANRCAMVSAAFVFAAMAAHLRRVEDRRSRWVWVELGLWALAFAGGEYATCGVAYVLAHTFVGRRDPWARRLRALGPALGALACFATAYVWMGAGVSGAAVYVDPIADPIAFLQILLERIPLMLGEAWLGMPGETWRLYERLEEAGLASFLFGGRDTIDAHQSMRVHAQFAVLAVASLAVPAWLLARPWLRAVERRVVAWTALGSVGALVPIAAIPPLSRSLLLAAFGPAVLVGALAVAAARAWTPGPRAFSVRVRASVLTIMAAGLFIRHTAIDALWVRRNLAGLDRTRQAYHAFYRNPRMRILDLDDKHVVVLTAPGLVTGMHGLSAMNLFGSRPASWHVLSMGQRSHLVRRHGVDALELSSVATAMHTQHQEMLFRPPSAALRRGDVIDVGIFRAEVVHEREDAGPDAILFTFARPLDDPDLVFLVIGSGGLERFALPPPGRPVALAPPELPSDSMPMRR